MPTKEQRDPRRRRRLCSCGRWCRCRVSIPKKKMSPLKCPSRRSLKSPSSTFKGPSTGQFKGFFSRIVPQDCTEDCWRGGTRDKLSRVFMASFPPSLFITSLRRRIEGGSEGQVLAFTAPPAALMRKPERHMLKRRARAHYN